MKYEIHKKIIYTLLLLFTVDEFLNIILGESYKYGVIIAPLAAELHEPSRPRDQYHIKEDAFRSKSVRLLVKRLNIQNETAFLDPRIRNLEYDESYPKCEYYTVGNDHHMDIGGAVGPYFVNIKPIIKIMSKVGMYEIQMTVDSTGFVSNAEIIKDTFGDDEVRALIHEAFSSMYFSLIPDTIPVKVVVRVVAFVEGGK
jgi:hypothetical protein